MVMERVLAARTEYSGRSQYKRRRQRRRTTVTTKLAKVLPVHVLDAKHVQLVPLSLSSLERLQVIKGDINSRK